MCSCPSTLDAAVCSANSISDVDISPFIHGEADRRSATTSWDTAFREVGFARIVGHQVPANLVADLRATALEFFKQPVAEKMRYNRPAPSPGSYSPVWSGVSSGGHDDPLEGYTFHRPSEGWKALTSRALGHPPALAAVAERYGSELERVMHTLHRVSSEALGLRHDFFDSPPGTNPTSLLVISHYPPLTDPDVPAREEGKPRYRAHSDYTGFTILLQDDDDHGGVAEAPLPEGDGGGGLEVDVGGRWMPVVPRAGSFVVNIGDLFELWTNNRWRSTPHRVSSPPSGSAAAARSRLTAMLFTGPALETVVQPAPTCGPSLYPTLTAREHLTTMALTKSKEAEYNPSKALRKAGKPSGKPAAAATAATGSSSGGGPGTGMGDGSSGDGGTGEVVTASASLQRLNTINTALTVAAGEGHVECTQLLLTVGPSREAMVLALRAAEERGKPEVVKIVQEALERTDGLALP